MSRLQAAATINSWLARGTPSEMCFYGLPHLICGAFLPCFQSKCVGRWVGDLAIYGQGYSPNASLLCWLLQCLQRAFFNCSLFPSQYVVEGHSEQQCVLIYGTGRERSSQSNCTRRVFWGRRHFGITNFHRLGHWNRNSLSPVFWKGKFPLLHVTLVNNGSFF